MAWYWWVLIVAAICLVVWMWCACVVAGRADDEWDRLVEEYEAQRSKPLECEACDATDADGNAFCEGCDCCRECCNCTPTDCDCDVCLDRRDA